MQTLSEVPRKSKCIRFNGKGGVGDYCPPRHDCTGGPYCKGQCKPKAPRKSKSGHDAETFNVPADVNDPEGPTEHGWYWEPRKARRNEYFGPFNTEADAIADAQGGAA